MHLLINLFHSGVLYIFCLSVHFPNRLQCPQNNGWEDGQIDKLDRQICLFTLANHIKYPVNIAHDSTDNVQSEVVSREVFTILDWIWTVHNIRPDCMASHITSCIHAR